MVVLQYPAALILQAVAAVIGKLPDVRLGTGQAENVLHPAVGIFPGEELYFQMASNSRCVFLLYGCIPPSWLYVWIKYIFKYIVEKNQHFSHSLGVGF